MKPTGAVKKPTNAVQKRCSKDFRRSSTNNDIERISIHDDKSMVRLAKYLGFYDKKLEMKDSVITIRNREIECIVKTNQLVWFEFDPHFCIGFASKL